MDVSQLVIARNLPEAVAKASQPNQYPWYTRLGAGITEEKVLALINAGYGYVVNAGTVTTPVAQGSTSIVVTTPDVDIEFPANKAGIILKVGVNIEAYGTTSLLEGMAAYGLGGAQAGLTAITPANLRTDKGNESGVVAGSDGTGATYMTKRTAEFWRFGQDKVVTIGTAVDTSPRETSGPRWLAKEEGFYPILVGAENLLARFNFFVAAQAVTYFAIVVFLSVPKEWLEVD